MYYHANICCKMFETLMKAESRKCLVSKILSTVFFIYILLCYLSNQSSILYWIQCHRNDISFGALAYFVFYIKYLDVFICINDSKVYPVKASYTFIKIM